MSWLKGPNVGGKITINDNIHFKGSVLADNLNQTWGTIYYVDATNGNDDYDGLTPARAFATIQAALTKQIADTTSLGDVIYVMPGTYAESITGDMTKVQIIGATCGGTEHSVILAPTAGNGWTGAMTNSAFRNIEFRTPSTSNLAYAAVAAKMDDSVIDSCSFLGATNTSYTVGLRIGAETPATWEHMINSSVSNCLFSTTGNRTFELKVGICFGQVEASTHAAYRQFIDSQIAYNRFYIHTTGVLIQCSAGNCGGGLVIGNDFGSHQSAGCINKGISAGGATLSLARYVNNTISCQTDAIEGFGAHNCMGNIVSANQATPDTEYFDGS